MKKYRYRLTTNTIWTNFDEDIIDAFNEKEALIKAVAKISLDLQKANKCLEKVGLNIEMDLTQIEITEITDF